MSDIFVLLLRYFPLFCLIENGMNLAQISTRRGGTPYCTADNDDEVNRTRFLMSD